MKEIARGRTAKVYLIDDDRILKLFEQWVPESDAQREYDISSYIYSNGIRAPQPFGIVKKDNLLGIEFEYVKGVSMLEFMSKKPFDILKLAKNLAEAQFEINKLVLSSEELGLMPSYKKKLENHIKRSHFSEKEKKKLTLLLEKTEDKYNLCHGDFHPDNVLINDEGYYVIDWLNCNYCDPLFDVSRTKLLLSFGTLPEGTRILKNLVFSIVRKIFMRQYLSHYIKLSGIKKSQLKKYDVLNSVFRLSENVPEKEKVKFKDIIKTYLEG